METNRQKFELTRAEAAKKIRRAPAGTRFALHVRVDLPIDGQPDRIFAGAGTGYLSLTRRDAVRLAEKMFEDTLEQRGARVPLSVLTMTGASGTSVTYWLG